MQDIDVAQWRNAQTLLLDSAKERRRIVVLHDDGRVRKVAHSHGTRVLSAPSQLGNALDGARALYEANSDNVDFVAVFERRAFDSYFAAVQDSWAIDEDLDAFVQRTYALLDEYPDGMVTYPGRARSNLGLQWRLGASRDTVIAAVQRFVAPGTSIILAVVDGGQLWASLVLTFDLDHKIVSATTVDTEDLTAVGSPADVADAVLSWGVARGLTCSLGLFLQRAVAEELLSSDHKSAALHDALADGRAVLDPAPPTLVSVLGWAPPGSALDSSQRIGEPPLWDDVTSRPAR
jgi:hypothetical protein